MSLRNQPYFPLYVQDFLTDEKLNECSAQSVGVYIKIMCIMHKSDEYGTILLKQKDKQNSSTTKNFACKLVKHLPFDVEIIDQSIIELVAENVLTIDGDKMYQRRMVKDNDISEKRSKSGREGGKKTQFAKGKVEAKCEANTEYEYEDENECESATISSISLKSKQNIFEKIIEQFSESYAIARGINYVVTSKGREIGMARKFLDIFKKQRPGLNTEQTLAEMRNYFDMCVTINNQWLYDNMNLSIIVSKFNEINTILRNGNQQRSGKSGATDAELAAIVFKHFGQQ